MIKMNRESIEASAVLTLVVLGCIAALWLVVAVVKHVIPDKPKPSFRDAFSQQERDYMKAQAIEECKETPNCHLHAGDVEWLINYDVHQGSQHE
jgi:hypothetical protein